MTGFESTRYLLVLLVIVAACTCGVRTECGKRGQISLMTSIHDDPSCRKLSAKGVLLYEAAKLLTEIHNNKSDSMDIELTVFDTCGSITGALKAAMKALVSADMNCLQPPFYLGIIGPDTLTNAEAVHKITSVLKVPHIVRKASGAPYLHHMARESDTYLVEAALKIIESLKWKSFTLVTNVDEENEDDVQNIAKKLTMAAIAKGLCVIVHDDNEDDFTSHVVHIGKPEDGFFTGPVNATVLVVSEGNLEEHLNRVNSTNTVLLLEDSRNEMPQLEGRMEKSKWWSNDDGVGKYDAEELREVRWLEDAIEIYVKAFDAMCKKKKCRNQVNAVDWNNVLSNMLTTYNVEIEANPRSLDLSIKSNAAKLQNLGSVIVRKNRAKIFWEGQKEEEEEEEDEDDEDNKKKVGKHDDRHHRDSNDDDDDESKEGNDAETDLPEAFERILSAGKDTKVGCATTTKEIKLLHEEDEDTARVLVSEMDDTEWWTMVGTVSGVGVGMFVVGTLAVYVVYTNIRGPRSPKSSKGADRDTSLRRVGSDRELPTTGRGQRHGGRAAQRRDSNRSIRSNMSDKSV